MTRGLRKHLQVDTFMKVDIDFKTNTASGWKLSTALAALNVTRKAVITVTIFPGVYVGNLNFDSAPAGSRVNLVVKGTLAGNSGGGDGMNAALKVSIDNQGTIAGGGGNGGNGGAGSHGGLNTSYACVYGQTVAAGSGGRGAGMSGANFVTASSGTSGAAASDSGARGGTGGRGGDLGQPGSPGNPGYTGNSWQGGTKVNPDGTTTYYPACGPYQGGISNFGSAGQSAGRAIVGIANVTFVNRGTILGPTV